MVEHNTLILHRLCAPIDQRQNSVTVLNERKVLYRATQSGNKVIAGTVLGSLCMTSGVVD